MSSILVTGIGGNVGQGILRNAQAFDPRLRLIGTDMREITSGNYLCDRVFKVPAASANDYLKTMKQICDKEKIDLIIPSTDIEGYHLSSHRKEFPVLAYSPVETNLIFWDKYQTWEHFSKSGIQFAESCLPSQWRGQFAQYIVKPRKGQGSKNLHISPAGLKTFTDQEYVVQKLYSGTEITTAFYVTKKRRLHGFITFKRQLQAGFTAMCEVSHEFDKGIHDILIAMVEKFEISGSCNVQSIGLSTGQVYPFEINGRISGTNSIRSQFGFKDVQYTLEEYLLNKEPASPVLSQGSAIRVLLDVIYPEQTLAEIKNKDSKHFIF